MPDGATWELIGVPEFSRAIEARIEHVNRATERALTASAQAAERQMKINANTGTHKRGEPTTATPGRGPNVVSGNLVRSITHTLPQRVGMFVWRCLVGVSRGAPYGEFLERGLRNGVTYPFVESAVRFVQQMVMPFVFEREWRAAVRGH